MPPWHAADSGVLFQGAACLVTGAAGSIGRAVAVALAQRGAAAITLLDVNVDGGRATEAAVRAAGAEALFIQCDLCDPAAQAAAFRRHWHDFGALDVTFLNAGVEELRPFLESPDDPAGDAAWRRVARLNFEAVADGVRLAVRGLRAARRGGVILINASAAGLLPISAAPVYSAAKAAAAHLARALGGLHAEEGIRVTALCPQYADTAMVARLRAHAPDAAGALLGAVGGELLTLDEVTAAAMRAIADTSNAGACLFLAPRTELYWSFRGTGGAGGAKAKRAAPPPLPPPAAPAYVAALAAWACEGAGAAREYDRVEVVRLTSDFRAATRVARARVPTAADVPAGHVLVRVAYAGVNASDVNFSSGRYFGGAKAAAARLPFGAGFEAVGAVAALGEGVSGVALGAPVGVLSFGSFAEYVVAEARALLPLHEASPAAVALLTSGLTAALALEHAGRLRPKGGETVLVTAAAGGTGQFAVQLAKLGGNTVVATCGGPAKAALLRGLGADAVIDYSTLPPGASLREPLRRAAPKGVDVVFESVGGRLFDDAAAALAQGGRLIVIGQMSAYTAGAGGAWEPSLHRGLPEALLWKGASVAGFFLPQHARHFRAAAARLCALHAAGKLRVAVDDARFEGVAAVADAVDRLQSGRSAGKVVVQIAAPPPPPPPPAAPAARL